MPNITYPRIEYRPKLVTIDATNNKIDFEETAATELTATLTNGVYTIAQLKNEIKNQLNAVGVSVYTVTYDQVARKYTLTSDGAGGGGVFNLLWDTGTNSAATVGAVIGFSTAADDTGSLTYTADNASFTSVTLDAEQPIRNPDIQLMPQQKTNISSSGRNETVDIRTDFMYSFSMQYINVDGIGVAGKTGADIDEWLDFFENAYLRGVQFDFYPDQTDLASHIALISADKRTSMREMVKRGLLGEFEFKMKTRVVQSGIDTPAGSNTIDTRQLIDRKS